MVVKVINKREKILEAAQKVFFQKSFYEATMDDIAQISGIKKPTIYYYFPSKIELASQLMEINMKKIFGKINEIILRTDNIQVRIERITDFYIDLLGENSKFFICLQRIAYDFLHKEDSKKKMNCFFEALLKRQKKAGNLFGEVQLSSGKKVSGNIFLYSIIASLGRVAFEAASQGKPPKKEDLKDIKNIFLASIQ